MTTTTTTEATRDLIGAARNLTRTRIDTNVGYAAQAQAWDRLTLATDAAEDALTDHADGRPSNPPTYHGICYAQCFTCGYGTSDTATLELWNDGGAGCMRCEVREGRILWVLTGGRVTITQEGPDGRVNVSALRLGNKYGTPPDAPGDHWPTGD